MADPGPILPWVEKYRPQNIDDIVQQEEVVNALRSTLGKGDLPHLIFHGPPGTGKTSTAIALCRTLFPAGEMRRRVMELNASDERGINAVRSKIKQFASLAVGPGEVPFKIIILDEADSMTRDAQNALRRVIESYSAVTRFIIICNYISKIIDPILSRCAKFRFKPLARESLVGRLTYIAQQEGLDVESSDAYDALVEISGGDLRKAITFLQSASITGAVSAGILREISGVPNPEDVVRFFETCTQNNPWAVVEEEAVGLVLSGYDLAQVLELLCGIVVGSTQLREEIKPGLLLKIANADGAIIERADPQIQFLALAAALNNAT
jgi:replication factor C subunit 2/4